MRTKIKLNKNMNTEDLISSPSKKAGYSNYREVILDKKDLGKGRVKHNRICNQHLKIYLENLKEKGESEWIFLNIESTIARIHKNPYVNNPAPSLVWEHTLARETIDGTEYKEGIMRLVPKYQHRPGSEFWQALHKNNKGGYHDWAVPHGAPLSRPAGYPPIPTSQQIGKMAIEQLADAFLTVVRTNRYNKFESLLARAKQLSVPEQELSAILSKPYHIGVRSKEQTLLHLAVANGNMDFINKLLEYNIATPNFIQKINYKGDTLAHIAAKNDRHLVLNKLVHMGADLNTKNNQKKLYTMLREIKILENVFITVRL